MKRALDSTTVFHQGGKPGTLRTLGDPGTVYTHRCENCYALFSCKPCRHLHNNRRRRICPRCVEGTPDE